MENTFLSLPDTIDFHFPKMKTILRNVIRNRWVFDIKSDQRKRARLVARGYSQVEGVDYDGLFSPVVCYETVRILLALCALEDWELEALDVKTAFLYGDLDEEIYMA